LKKIDFSIYIFLGSLLALALFMTYLILRAVKGIQMSSGSAPTIYVSVPVNDSVTTVANSSPTAIGQGGTGGQAIASGGSGGQGGGLAGVATQAVGNVLDYLFGTKYVTQTVTGNPEEGKKILEAWQSGTLT
jgi:hypothetical protein